MFSKHKFSNKVTDFYGLNNQKYSDRSRY